MNKSEFQEEYFERTGKILDGDLLDYYYNLENAYYKDCEDESYNRASSYHSNISGYKNRSYFDDEDENIFDDCIAREVGSIFKNVYTRAKRVIKQKQHDMDLKNRLNELSFNFQLFLIKSILYILLDKGEEKGYKYKDF
jgi:hypothetical protein